MHDVFHIKIYKLRLCVGWILVLNTFTKSDQCIFSCSIDVGLSLITCFVQCCVSKSESEPAQSQGFKRHHVLALILLCFCHSPWEEHAQGVAGTWTMKRNRELTWSQTPGWSQDQPRSAEPCTHPSLPAALWGWTQCYIGRWDLECVWMLIVVSIHNTKFTILTAFKCAILSR